MRINWSSLAALACLGVGEPPGEALSPAEVANRAATREMGRALVPLHGPMGGARPGDWRLRFPDEPGQSFDQYLLAKPNRPGKGWTTLYLQPLGPFDANQRKLLDETSRLLGLFYGLPVKVLGPIGLGALPDRAKRNHPVDGNPQVHSLAVLDLLKPLRPADALAVLCLTASDLYPEEKWNFVFGQASLGDRVGVWSVARLGDPAKDYPLVLRRTLKVAVHETGHMFGIPHCRAFACGMNGSNNRGELDRDPLPFCPECEMKVWWNVGLDPIERYRRLVEFAEVRGMDAEDRAWRLGLKALEASRRRKP